MSEPLLHAIIEKLGAQEILLKQVIEDKDESKQNLPSQQLQMSQTDAQKMTEQILLTQERMHELKLEIGALREQLKQPLKNQIEHKHHLHKGVWIAIILFIASLFFLRQWMTMDAKKLYEANDIKYRALSVTGGKGLLMLLDHTDSLYELNPTQMTQWVIREEKRFIDQARMLQFEGEKKANKALR